MNFIGFPQKPSVMDVYVPYSPRNPKTRLSPLLTESERHELSRVMLQDVVETIASTGHAPIVLTTEPLNLDIKTVVSTKPLSNAVNSILCRYNHPERQVPEQHTAQPVSIVMADLGLLTEDALARLFTVEADVTLAPGLRGGTNALVTRSAGFRVDYHGTSYLDHRAIAREHGLEVTETDSLRLSCDIDEPDDIIELLLHGTGQAREYVDTHFELAPKGEADTIRRTSQVY